MWRYNADFNHSNDAMLATDLMSEMNTSKENGPIQIRSNEQEMEKLICAL